MSSPTPLSDAYPRRGSSLFLALKASPADTRDTAGHWVRWWHEVSQIPCTVSDPGVADRKLAWWAQAVQDSMTQPPSHPLLQALAGPGRTLAQPRLPELSVWLNQLAGLQTLTQQTRWMDEATLLDHVRRTTGAACQGWVWLGGARSAEALALAQDLGVALRQAHILFRLGQDAQAGWLHLPIDVLQRHGVRAHEILRPVAAQPGPEIRGLLHDRAMQARSALRHLSERVASPLPAEERRAFRPLRVLARLSDHLLSDLEQQGYPVLTQRITLGPLRKHWIAQTTPWRRS